MDEQLKILDEEIKKKRACNDLEGMQTYSAELRKLSHAKHNRCLLYTSALRLQNDRSGHFPAANGRN